MIITENELYPFNAFTIPDKFAKKAEVELGETDEAKMIGLQELREKIRKEGNLVCRVTDDFLLKFLRARKYNTEKSISLLKKYTNFKKKNQSIFTGMNYDVLAKLVKNKTFGFLPYRCPDGCAVMVVHLENWNPSQVSMQDLSRAIVIFFYHSIRDPLTQVNGYKLIFDVKSPGLKHLRFCTPGNIFLLYTGTQECFPGRFKGIHIMNMSLTFQLAWKIVSPFLSEKLKSRIILHDDYSTLQDYFPLSIIPTYFGGQLTDYDTIPWLKKATTEESLDKLAN